MRSKKGGVFDELGALAVGIATLVIVLSIAFLVMAETRTQDESITGLTCNSTDGSAGCNSTKTLQTATQSVPDWVPLIVLVAIGGTILGMVAMFGKRN